MANRYWVGGTGAWTPTNTANWSTASGGTGGASVPTAADSVYFDQAGTYTVTIGASSTTTPCLNFVHSAGTVTFTGSAVGSVLQISGSLYLASTAIFTYSRTINMVSNGTETINTNGVSFPSLTLTPTTYGNFSLGSALTINGNIIIKNCTFNTNNYAWTTSSSVQIQATASIILGSSTVAFGSFFAATGISYTFDAGTSTINVNNTLDFGSLSPVNLYNINVNASATSFNFGGGIGGTYPTIPVTCNNFTINAPASQGNRLFTFYYSNITVNQTFTITPSTNATYRIFLYGNNPVIRTTFTCNAVSSLQDVDFKYIVFDGNCIAGGNITGTRLGNAGYNSNITFPAPKTVYWNLATGGNWTSANGWTNTIGGTPDVQYFPLAQDTAVFPVTGLNSGATVSASGYTSVVGTIDMSARTSATMTLSMSNCYICQDFIVGSGCTISGTVLLYSARDSFVTTAGKLMPSIIIISYPYSVTLNDALTVGYLTINAGRFNTANYSVTITANISFANGIYRTDKILDIGSSTIVFSGSGTVFNCNNNYGAWYTAFQPQILGTGTLNFTSASAKTLNAYGVYIPVVNQGGAGALTIAGTATFGNITNTAVGNVLFNPAAGVFTFNNFSLNGTSAAALLTVSSTTGLAQARLKKTGTWYMGANSVNSGNNSNLVFSAGGNCNYLSVSWISGEDSNPANMLNMIGA